MLRKGYFINITKFTTSPGKRYKANSLTGCGEKRKEKRRKKKGLKVLCGAFGNSKNKHLFILLFRAYIHIRAVDQPLIVIFFNFRAYL